MYTVLKFPMFKANFVGFTAISLNVYGMGLNAQVIKIAAFWLMTYMADFIAWWVNNEGGDCQHNT